VALREEKVGVAAGPGEKTGSNGHTNGSAGAKKPAARNGRNGIAKAIAGADRPVHPVTLWRGRLSVALDALQTDPDSGADRPRFRRRSPVETTNVQLPTGDRLLVPTGAETLRLKGYLLMCRNSRRDYADFADMVDALEPETAAVVLAGMDRYYCCESSRRQWIATQLVRRLADPDPCDYPDDQGPDADAPADWEQIRQRCLAVAVAMLEEAR
jgi:RND superfamily putative drug exporter